ERVRGAKYLLQGLIVCGCCQYAYYGITATKPAKTQHQHCHRYYRCPGTDPGRFGGERICDNRSVQGEELDEAVWQDVKQLLQDPKILKQEYERRLGEPMEESAQEQELRRQQQSARNAIERLIDVYTEGTLTKAQFEPRLQRIRERLARLDDEASK